MSKPRRGNNPIISRTLHNPNTPTMPSDPDPTLLPQQPNPGTLSASLGPVPPSSVTSASFLHRSKFHSHIRSAQHTLSTTPRLPSTLVVALSVSALIVTLLAFQFNYLICPQLNLNNSQQLEQQLLLLQQQQNLTNLNSTTIHFSSFSNTSSLSSTSPSKTSFDLIPSLEAWKDPSYARARLAVYVYDLPSRFNYDLVQASHMSPSHIRDPYCDENFYSSEVHVHRFLLQSSVRVTDPSLANLFYVPIYTTCDLINSQPNNLLRTGRNFRRAMRHVIHDHPYWNASDGRDHVFLFSQGFSARLAGDWTKIKNAIFLVHNGEFTALEYTPHKDLTIPPELRAYFQPIYRLPAHKRPTAKSRRYLAQFGGQVVDGRVSDHRGSNYSRGVRQFIRQKLAPDQTKYRITGVRAPSYLDDMMSSKFCLAPEGWHPWSPRPYYSIHMGCIPVIVSDVQELAFEEFIDWDSFAVWIRPSDIEAIDDILSTFTESQLQQRRDAMERVWRAFWYDGPEALGYQAILQALYNRRPERRPRRHFSTRTQVESRQPS